MACIAQLFEDYDASFREYLEQLQSETTSLREAYVPDPELEAASQEMRDRFQDMRDEMRDLRGQFQAGGNADAYAGELHHARYAVGQVLLETGLRQHRGQPRVEQVEVHRVEGEHRGEDREGDDPRLAEFYVAFEAMMIDLAQQIVRDGEGATKFITVRVTGAEDDRAAKVIALSIANSPLVKTAIAGEDANWGRIVMAVGKAGEAADRDRLQIEIGGQRLTEGGMATADYDEDACTAHLKGQNIDILVDVGVDGPGLATVWTCDLTHGYITINADYRS